MIFDADEPHEAVFISRQPLFKKKKKRTLDARHRIHPLSSVPMMWKVEAAQGETVLHEWNWLIRWEHKLFGNWSWGWSRIRAVWHVRPRPSIWIFAFIFLLQCGCRQEEAVSTGLRTELLPAAFGSLWKSWRISAGGWGLCFSFCNGSPTDLMVWVLSPKTSSFLPLLLRTFCYKLCNAFTPTFRVWGTVDKVHKSCTVKLVAGHQSLQTLWCAENNNRWKNKTQEKEIFTKNVK